MRSSLHSGTSRFRVSFVAPVELSLNRYSLAIDKSKNVNLWATTSVNYL